MWFSLQIDSRTGKIKKSGPGGPALVKKLSGSNIRKWFDLPLGALRSSPNLFPSKNRFEAFDLFYNFHTDLPFSMIRLSKKKGRDLTGSVFLTELGRRAPSLIFLSVSPFIMLDAQGRIRCVNNAFMKLFSGKKHDAARFIGKPVTGFLDENPLDRISALAPDEPERTWKTVAGLKAGQYNLSQEGLLELPGKVNAVEHDYRISVTLDAGKTGLPLFVLNGGPKDVGMFPDFDGYLLGPDPEGKKLRVKKKGAAVFQAPVSLPSMDKPVTVEAQKAGNRLSYFVNSECLLTFNDTDPVEGAESRPYLFFRKPGRVSINRLNVSVSPARPAAAPKELMLLNSAGGACFLHQLVDEITLAGNTLYYGFILQDVSPLARERDRFRTIAESRETDAGGMIGNSSAFKSIREKARVAAASGITVLVEGETGTGKELLARYIHAHSPFRDGPFIKVDCSTLPESLMESELFGHERGAFTGAAAARMGRLEAADRGTLFLDEIGNLSLLVQAKLLSFLQDFELVRLGGNRRIKVRTRIIAALNKPLLDLVRTGLFREDLYYRLNVVGLKLSPLRERKEDIPALCEHFLKKFGRKNISSGAYEQIMDYPWPGNVRELENALRQAALFCEGETIEPGHLKLSVAGKGAPVITENEVPKGIARALRTEHVRYLMEKHHGIIAHAAKEAGVPRATFYRKLRKFNIPFNT
jgi:DNA-binding NtrC family response regulator